MPFRTAMLLSRSTPMLRAVVVAALALFPALLLANNPPAQPVITEPSQDGKILSPADVHMETAAFSDPDPGDTHLCTDWEIWTVNPAERVWITACIGGIEKLHTHLGDGVFENSHAGRAELFPDKDYKLRVRHRDKSGDPVTEWSAWAERTFRTAPLVPPSPGASGWLVRQPGYKVEIVATNFQLPVNIAFVPNPTFHPDDPFFYVTELYGHIKVVTHDGTVRDYATNLLNFNPTGAFPGSGEQGLTGIVVEPATGDVFASLLYDSAGNHYPKVVRFHSTDGGLTPATQTTILAMPGETQGQSHQISRLSIGPDGKLYVHMGDGFDATKGQNTNSFRGKILRLNLDGTPASDNPFYNAANGTTATDYIFAYGLRNPFGGDWRAADTNLYEVENGPSRDRFAKIVRGRNYLYDGSDNSMTNFALHVWIPATGPVNLAFIQTNVFGGSGFPTDKFDHAFVSDSGSTYASGPQGNGKRITEFVLDASGNKLSGPTNLIEYNGTGKATVVALAAGPDGLYFSDLYKDDDTVATNRGANILRVRYVGLPPAGNGDGLKGEFYDNIDLTNLKFIRTNPVVDFNWGAGSPDPAIGTNTFSVRWTGQLQPQFTETYTFTTTTDDGVRLWVDGQLLVDSWVDQGATERGGSWALRAFRRYGLRMEYYENGGSAVAQLRWSSPSTPKTIIPQTQLYSASNAPAPLRFTSIELLTNALAQMPATGNPGDVQRLESSANLVNWTPLQALTNITGSVIFTEPLTNSRQFYRLNVSPQPFPIEIIVDNPTATVAGAWTNASTAVDKYGPNYLSKGTGTGTGFVRFTPNLPIPGSYQVYEWHTQGSNRATNAPWVITFNGGVMTNRVDQQSGGGVWNLLGTFTFAAGTSGNATLTDAFTDASRLAVADAVRFVYVSP